MTQPPDLVYVKSLLAPFTVLTSNSIRVKIKKSCQSYLHGSLTYTFTFGYSFQIHFSTPHNPSHPTPEMSPPLHATIDYTQPSLLHPS